MSRRLVKLQYILLVLLSTAVGSLTLLSLIGILTFGYIPLGIIVTTSMMPKLPPGTVVLAVPVFNPCRDLHPGDIAIYCAKVKIFGVSICKPIIHRVVGISRDCKVIYFMGDANNVIEPVNPRQVVSKVVFYIPSLYWVRISNRVGVYIPCGVLLLILILLMPKIYEVTIREV